MSEEIEVKIKGFGSNNIIFEEANSKRKRSVSVEDDQILEEIASQPLPTRKKVKIVNNKLVAMRQS